MGSGPTARSCQQQFWAPRLSIWNNFATERQASKHFHRLSPQQQPLTSPSALTALARVVEACATGFRQSSSHCSMEARARPSPDCRAPEREDGEGVGGKAGQRGRPKHAHRLSCMKHHSRMQCTQCSVPERCSESGAVPAPYPGPRRRRVPPAHPAAGGTAGDAAEEHNN